LARPGEVLATSWWRNLARSLLAASVAWLPQVRAASAESVKAVVHVQGRTVEIAAQTVRDSGLVQACEQQVLGATSVLRLGVSSATIEQQRRIGLAVELSYEQPRRFVLAGMGRTIEVSHMLIPLAGDLAGGITTVFFGNPQYQAGPLRNDQGTAELARLVKSLR